MASGISYSQAYDQICALFKSAWDTQLGDEAPVVDWPNIERLDNIKLNDENEPWLRFNLQFAKGTQKSLGPKGYRIFKRIGIVTIQVFTPINKRGLQSAHDLAKVAADAFEGEVTEGGVRFYDVSVETIGKSENIWHQTNVTTRFEYYEIK